MRRNRSVPRRGATDPAALARHSALEPLLAQFWAVCGSFEALRAAASPVDPALNYRGCFDGGAVYNRKTVLRVS